MSYIVQFDGSCNPNPGGRTRFGCVVYKDGVEVATRSGFISPIGTNNEAEWIALINAIELCDELKIEHAIIQGDSKLVIFQIQDIWRVKSKNLVNFYNYTKKQICESKCGFTFEHIPRKANGRADALAWL